MRHGIAAAGASARSASDSERPLTAKGMKRTRRAAKGLAALEPSVQKLLTSPLVRARQTADIVAEALGLENRIEDLPELAPAGEVEKITGRIASFQEAEGFMLVGHQPLLGKLASFLLTGNTHLQIDLKKSSVCCISVDSLPVVKNGILRWMLTPRQLRNLAR